MLILKKKKKKLIQRTFLYLLLSVSHLFFSPKLFSTRLSPQMLLSSSSKPPFLVNPTGNSQSSSYSFVFLTIDHPLVLETLYSVGFWTNTLLCLPSNFMVVSFKWISCWFVYFWFSHLNYISWSTQWLHSQTHFCHILYHYLDNLSSSTASI